MVVEAAAPFPLTGPVMSSRGESETAVHVSAAVQWLACKEKLPAKEAPVVPDPLGTLALDGLREKAQVTGAKLAVAVRGPVILIEVEAVVPLASPVHPVNWNPAFGVAVNVTAAPAL